MSPSLLHSSLITMRLPSLNVHKTGGIPRSVDLSASLVEAEANSVSQVLACTGRAANRLGRTEIEDETYKTGRYLIAPFAN